MAVSQSDRQTDRRDTTTQTKFCLFVCPCCVACKELESWWQAEGCGQRTRSEEREYHNSDNEVLFLRVFKENECVGMERDGTDGSRNGRIRVSKVWEIIEGVRRQESQGKRREEGRKEANNNGMK
jgi:hypothetical protein